MHAYSDSEPEEEDDHDADDFREDSVTSDDNERQSYSHTDHDDLVSDSTDSHSGELRDSEAECDPHASSEKSIRPAKVKTDEKSIRSNDKVSCTSMESSRVMLQSG